MKLVRFLALVLVLACAFPAGAAALNLEVNTLADEGPGNCAEGCTLRDAIIEADASEEPDTITFGVAGTIAPEFPLPELEGSITIDATTPEEWAGSPVVYLDGSGAFFEGGTWGLRVRTGSTASINGLAIGEFDLGIYFEPGSSGEACGNYLGTDLSGTQPRPNFDGIWVDQSSEGVRVGRGCGEIGGNLVSGNEEWGMVVAGEEVEVDQNLVGTDAAGTGPLPNGPPPETVEPFGGGIYVTSQAAEVLVGGVDVGGLPHNVVAFNQGPGVLIGDDASLTTVRENSIHSNTGLGIERQSGNLVPAITRVGEIANGTTTVTGTLQGTANTEYELEFFSNEECDPSGFGEGQYFVASDEVSTDDAGQAQFSATLLGLAPPAAHFLTLTATDVGHTITSEFSNCVPAEPSPEEEEGPPAALSAPPPPPPPPTPVNGRSVVIAPQSGRVLVRVPGSKRFVPLSGLTSVPLGSIIDTIHGRVTLTSVDANGVTQTADFYQGRFQVQQNVGAVLVTLRLRGGDFSSCSRAEGSRAGASKRSGRRLWGNGSGRFRTQGNFGSASVMGTIWLTVDQCKGTFFKVRRGVVRVADFVLDRTVTLRAGRSYLAKKPQN